MTTAELNPYKPPTAALVEPDDASTDQSASLYVVAPHKFMLMMLGTFGGYQLYWFYRNWAQLNASHRSYWPVARAIFAVFFTHSLLREVDGILARKRIAYAWSPTSIAGAYVAFTVMDNVTGRAIDGAFGVVLGIAFMLARTFALYRAQLAINAAEEDPAGAANRAITIANLAWLLVGLLVWGLVGVAFFAPD